MHVATGAGGGLYYCIGKLHLTPERHAAMQPGSVAAGCW